MPMYIALCRISSLPLFISSSASLSLAAGSHFPLCGQDWFSEPMLSEPPTALCAAPARPARLADFVPTLVLIIQRTHHSHSSLSLRRLLAARSSHRSHVVSNGGWTRRPSLRCPCRYAARRCRWCRAYRQ